NILNTVQQFKSSKDKDSFPREFAIKKRKVVITPLRDSQGTVEKQTLTNDLNTEQVNHKKTQENLTQARTAALTTQRDNVLNNEHFIPSNIIKSVNNCSFPILPIYTREEYEEIYNLLIKNSSAITRHKFIVTGTSGIGHVDAGTLDDFSDYLKSQETWYLVDGVTPEDVEAKTIIALFPQSIKIRNYKAYPSARGIMLELYVIHLFITGDCHFETWKLEDLNVDNDECTETYTVKPHPKIEYILNPEELASHNEEKVIVPSKSNFGAADLFVSPNDIFQITVSHRHPIKQTELVNIVKNIPGYIKDSNAKIRLYFVVSDDIYENYKTQDIVTRDVDTKSLRKVKTQNSILKNVEQW
ncbi:5500_t:CDS:2, partial [Gigaspora margarita]